MSSEKFKKSFLNFLACSFLFAITLFFATMSVLFLSFDLGLGPICLYLFGFILGVCAVYERTYKKGRIFPRFFLITLISIFLISLSMDSMLGALIFVFYYFLGFFSGLFGSLFVCTLIIFPKQYK